MAFLAGSTTSVFVYGNTISVPYIGAQIVTNLYGNVLDFNIINNSYINSGATYSGGNINILSKYGNVLINGLVFPSYSQNVPFTVADNSILVYKNIGGNAYLQWATNNSANLTSITASGTFSIMADSIYLNGFNTVFSDSRPTPIAVGSIAVGSTFSNLPLIELLRMIVYPYVPPRLTLSPASYFVEVTTTGVVGLSFSITKVTATSSILSITSNPLFLSGTSSALTYLNATSSINRTYTGTGSFSSGTYFATTGIKSFTMSVRDNITGTTSVTTNMNVVYPIFYGTSTVSTSSQAVVQSLLNSFTKVVDNNISKTVPISGTAVCIYYCVPNIYNTGGTISSVFDVSNPSVNIRNNFRGSGMAFTMSLSSPSGFWGSTLYSCYIYSPSGSATSSNIGNSPFYTANYQFNF